MLSRKNLQNSFRLILIILAVNLLLIFLASPCSSYAKETFEKKHILVINSYNPGYLWSDLEMQGIQSVLGLNPAIQTSYEYLDTKRIFDKQHFKNVYKLFKHKFAKDKFNLILISDNDAFEFIKKYRNKLFPNVPVVFCGINDFEDSMLKGQKKITGVIEVVGYKESIEIALKLRPAANQIVVVSDKTKTGIAHENMVRDLVSEFKDKAKFTFLSLGNMTMKEMQDKLSRLKDDSLVLLLAHFKDKTGHFFSVQESLKLLTKSSSVPCFVVTSDRIGFGVVGGMVVSGFYQGETAAKMAMRVLNGEPVENIPVLKESPNKYIFDCEVMQRWGIKEKDLPNGSIIKNRPVSFYETNKLLVWSIISVLLLFALIIIVLFLNIARRKKIESELRINKDKLSGILETVPDGITIVDSDGKITFANKAAEAILRLKKDDITERTYSDPSWNITTSDGSLFPVDELPFARVKRTQQPVFNLEHAIEHPDKTRTILSVNAAPLYDADGSFSEMIASITDITERKKAEKALFKSEERYRELIENANSIILRWTHDGKITYMNEFGQKFFNYTESEIIGRHVVGTIVPETDSSGRDLRHFMDEICADPHKFESNINENMRRNGERVWIAWTNKVVLDEQGQIKEIMSIGSDITERRQAEQELKRHRDHLDNLVQERTKELTEANIKLKELDRLKSMFIASMSHELRTPLNSIIGFSSIILNEWMGPLNKEQKQNLSSVLKSGKHLLSLINDVIDVSKIEAGMIEINTEDFDLDSVIQETADSFKNEIRDKKLKLEVESIHLIMSTDRRRLLQVVMNLISNAVKFTEKGSVHINTRKIAGSVEIVVEDTGIGIKDEDIPKLFSAFIRLESHLKATVLGTGLGLYLTKKLVQEVLKGEIIVESRYKKGSRFAIRIPIKI